VRVLIDLNSRVIGEGLVTKLSLVRHALDPFAVAGKRFVEKGDHLPDRY
jgi:hypothetical protein